ncbi:MAG: SMC-Scp complex subunit ScpB [Deltaproteobacteria bacterium]|nr:SMC-Scp complex subunit ScpB [Deltaproteobacteria bacterium]MBW1930870.1 SMC-Scp complex subunit ScpB [Deltaproteobacteria bacterium]MBW2026353.1 SMC-Scp complex subunit ScpB [Deltaproteobacteria bacterium]MBW2125501.1 SMC-Scp complex subunit ScpB [Deltaproteobacteria bacterium]RLB14147.1 MAG: SMC-Scp complex subunit ScpB [Deltaproteobacteria bacterium]
MNKSTKLIVEALLFSSDRPLSAKEIQAWIPDSTLADIKTALTQLVEDYAHLERSFSLKEVAGGYQFRTHPMFAPFILRMLKTSPTRLSKAALETLAIVAYKQPILRQEIERLRGVDVGGILRSLMEKGLIRIVGRKNLPGRPLIYGTTKKFLEVFGLKDLNALPKLKEIKELAPDEQEGSQTKEIFRPEESHRQAPSAENQPQ